MGREKGGGAQISGIRIFAQADAGVSGFAKLAFSLRQTQGWGRCGILGIPHFSAGRRRGYRIPQFGVFGKGHMGLPDLPSGHFR